MAVAADRHSRPRRLGRLQRALARRHARHDADGVVESLADDLDRHRNGELAELRPGGFPQGQAAEQRGVPEIRRLRRRRRRGDALRHQPAGRQVRHCLRARPGEGLLRRRRGRRLRPDRASRHPVRAGRHRLQARGRAVPLLVSRRVRGGGGRGRRLSLRRLEGRRTGPARPSHHELLRPRTARPGPGCETGRALAGAGAGVLRRAHGHVRQPGRVHADEPEAAAGLLDHRPRRLHDDGLDAADLRGRRGDALLPHRLPVHEPGRLRRRRLPAQPDRVGRPARLSRPGAALAVDGHHAERVPAQPARHPAAGRFLRQVPGVRRPV